MCGRYASRALSVLFLALALHHPSFSQDIAPRLLSISAQILSASATLRNELDSWRMTSELLGQELQNSKRETAEARKQLDLLTIELDAQKPRLTELSERLLGLEKESEELKTQLLLSKTQAEKSQEYVRTLYDKQSKTEASRNLWKSLTLFGIPIGMVLTGLIFFFGVK